MQESDGTWRPNAHFAGSSFEKKNCSRKLWEKKFQEQNLSRIEEAFRDTSVAFDWPPLLNFKSRSAKGQLEIIMRFLLSKLKEWIRCNEKDAYFKYYSQMFILFGQLQQMYINAITYGNGVAREAVWMTMHPLFAQSNKCNYNTEAMVHIINFTILWPTLTRELLKRNCSISLSGKVGHNISLDEWVEMCVVQPLKNYATGKVHYPTVNNIAYWMPVYV